MNAVLPLRGSDLGEWISCWVNYTQHTPPLQGNLITSSWDNWQRIQQSLRKDWQARFVSKHGHIHREHLVFSDPGACTLFVLTWS